MSKPLNLEGERYDRLLVIKRDPDNKRKWICKCDCGNIISVYASNMRRGLTKSCGCLRKERGQQKLIDLTGQKYGKLTVLKQHHYDPETRIYYWTCQCNCGSIIIVAGNHLKSGHTQSCGCLISKGEEKIAQLLIENNISFKKQYSFPNLLGTNGGRLRFDFAIFDKNNNLLYLIEYDGWQHEIKKDTKWDRNNAFETRQIHDKMKTQYCQEHNIPLIRITSEQFKTFSINDLKLNIGE